MKRILSLLFVLNIYMINAQNYSLLNSVMAWAEADATKPSLTLKWKTDPTDSVFTIYRKLKNSNSWGTKPLVTLGKGSSLYRDTTVKLGSAYEYRIQRVSTARVFANSYLYGGVNVDPIELRKTILVLVDQRISDGITVERAQLIEDLKNETWNVIERIIPSSFKDFDVKDTILAVRNRFPNLTSVFIIGHVAVPYSGNTAWDGHVTATDNHQGAWVCDNYYADLDGFWADELISNLAPIRNENKNEIGDGKYDDSVIPSDVELEVGRVDFFNMPAFKLKEIELLKKYLNKDHLFRIGSIRPERRAIVQDNINFQGEYFGSTGYKNFTVLVGPDSVKTDIFRDRMLEKSYLLAYGAGFGSYTTSSGITTTSNLVVDSLRGIFTYMFGSFFGDWDVQDNLLRAALGSGTVLTCAWAGRPGWQMHHMSMGETIGFSTKTTVNDNLYSGSPIGNRGAHVSLLGDPSLTLLPVKPPINLNVSEAGPKINLSWTESPEATHGYSIFRRKLPETSFIKIADGVMGNTYSDKCLKKNDEYEYLVAAIKLDVNGSGTFYNRSAGARGTIIVKNSNQVEISNSDVVINQDYETLHAQLKSNVNNVIGLKWTINGNQYSGDSIQIDLPCSPSNQILNMIAEGECNSDSITIPVNVVCSTPEVIKYSTDPEIKCFGDVTNITLDSITGATPFSFNWSTGSTTNQVKNVKGQINVEITSSKGTKKSFTINLPEYTQVQITDIQVKNINVGFNKGKVTSVSSQGGVPPYQHRVLNVTKQDSLEAGTYTLEVTDANGCTSTKTFEIKINVAVIDVPSTLTTVYPNPAGHELYIKSQDQISALEIINIEGKLIATPAIQHIAKDLYKINIQSLNPGMYYLNIKDKKKTSAIQFVKE